MNKKQILILFLVAIAIVLVGYTLYFKNNSNQVLDNQVPALVSGVVYKNTKFGFDFSLPDSWEGYTTIEDKWIGNPLASSSVQSGPKIILRNPKWTEAAPYEDLPILIFTISEWNSYTAEDFAVSAAPIQARELARNDTYVFALPPRWDFDYSLDFKEAEDIFAGNPIHPFNLNN